MKILIIQQKMIGDVLTSSILFEALRSKYPEAKLHYLIYSHTKPVVENNPFIDEIITFNPKEKKKLSYLLRVSKNIRKQNFDIVIDVYSKINSAFLTRFSGAKMRVSYQKWYSTRAYTRTFKLKNKPKTEAGLAIENRMLLLKAISENFPIEIQPKIYLTKTEKNWAAKKLRKERVFLNKPLFIIGVLGSSVKKTYPLHYMAEILESIVNETDATLLFNYTPSQEKEVKELFLKCNLKTQQNIRLKIYGRSLREFMALTFYCDAFIGNEGGAVNMAKALGTPTFSIFSPQIKKENWSLYEDNLNNVSVHLKDYKPELFENKSNKDIHRSNEILYDKFKPSHFSKKFLKFVKNINR